VYLLVNDLSDVQKLEGRMSLSMLLKDVQILKRKNEESTSQQVNWIFIYYIKKT